MAVAIPLIMVAGAALSAYAAVQQANAQKQAAQFNAKLNERNATVAVQQAGADALQVRRQAAQAQGAAVAEYGASGVALEGSPLDVLGAGEQQAQLAESTVRYRGELKAMGYHSNAELDRMAGRTAERQGYLNAASALLTGVGRASSAYDGSSASDPTAEADAIRLQDEAAVRYGIRR